MKLYRHSKSKFWWFRFTWNGRQVRESTRVTDKRQAEQIAAARRTELAKGEVGLRDRAPVSTLKEFIEHDFRPHVETVFAAKDQTRRYYGNGMKNVLAFPRLAKARLDAITGQDIAAFAAHRQSRGSRVALINRELQALRRMFALAAEWGKVEKPLPRVRMLPGENRRERVLSPQEEVFVSYECPIRRNERPFGPATLS